MQRFIVRGVRAPRTLWNGLFDRVVVPAWLNLLGVELGQGCRFAGLPAVKIQPGAQIRLGDGVVIFNRLANNPRAIAHPTILATLNASSRITIGDHAGISGASIVAGEAIHIGAWVLIGPGACLWDNDGHPIDPQERRVRPVTEIRTAPIRIEDDVFIGAQALVLKGVTVGAGAIVAARSVVTRDVAPGAIVAGNPARVVGHVRDASPKRAPASEE